VARVSRICVCVMLMVVGLAVSGCSGASRLTGLGGFNDAPAVAAPDVNLASQPMQAGDHINVTVYNEASLSGNYSIDSGGFVTIPRAGRLRAAGLAPSEFAALLVRKFRGEYLSNPKVTVALI
jgi:protein involved in polysaccharide export with SLBB domain